MKKIIFTFAIIFLLQNKAFPQIEMHLTVPIGASFIYPYTDGTKFYQTEPYYIDHNVYSTSAYYTTAFNTGALMQIGHRFDLKYETGVTSISLLADIGYSYEIFNALYFEDNLPKKYINQDVTVFHTLNLGIIPKINFYFPSLKIPFSIGLGGGVKIPLSGTRWLTEFSGKLTTENLSYKDIKETFLYPFMPYIKLTADTYFYVSKQIALTVGLYMLYNFGMQYDTDKLNAEGSSELHPDDPLELTEYGYTSFDIGVTFGISFGRANPKQ